EGIMNTTHLTISHLWKSFGKTQVLRDISLEIPKGCFMTFLGPSGCGKTTLLRTIAGFYKADSGDISIGEKVINDVPSHQRNAIMVFQDYALFPHMTVLQNVTYGLRIKGLPAAEIRDRAERTMEYLGIRGLEQRSPSQISGGQQQRVALARALVMEPEVLLLDEPLSNLDAKLRMNIRAELRQLQQRFGITTIYVTHDQSEALALSDQIAVMSGGQVIQVGAPLEIYYRPMTEFVADFIGTANIIRGRMRERTSEGILVECGGHDILVSDAADPPPIGSDVSLCCRPETVGIDRDGQTGLRNQLRGTIEAHIFEGSHVRYWVRVGERTMVVDDADASERGIFSGEVVLALHPKKLHLLSTEQVR
ncbi:MAG TPA: ABC transporter ATP-binding protein, partial [Spirochaetia bacterium]|nr:ABC transporter ATP-binding protein [Spirochaetia bacterium]